MNRRSAPSLYRSVHRVVRRNDGKLAIDADGTIVDAVLEMKRFDEDGLLDRMAVRGDLTPLIVTRLASVVANFHSHAEPSLPGARSGPVGTPSAITEASHAKFVLQGAGNSLP